MLLIKYYRFLCTHTLSCDRNFSLSESTTNSMNTVNVCAPDSNGMDNAQILCHKRRKSMVHGQWFNLQK